MSNSPWFPEESPDARNSSERDGNPLAQQPPGSLGTPESPVTYVQGAPASSSPDLMVDPLIDRFDLTFLLKKNFLRLVLAPLICAALGIFLYMKQETLYESSALLMVDSSLDQLLQFESSGQGSDHNQESLKSLEVAVVADSVVLRVINRLDLKNAPGFLPAELGDAATLPDTEFLHFLREKRIHATLQPETRLIRISVSDTEPERARQIAETFVEEFEGFLADQRKSEALKVKDSIEEQVEDAKQAALASEDILRKYREDNSDFPMEQDHTLFSSRLSQLGEDLNAASRSRVEIESIVASVEDIDPKTHPVDIIEIADYRGVSHVSSLISSLSESKSRLAVAAQRYPEGSPSYLAVKAEVDRNVELIQEQAADIKNSLESKYNAAVKREQLIKNELATSQNQFVEMKSKSSEFRILQTESENKWKIYQDLQQRLGSTIMATELPGSIATVVSEPLTPYTDSRPPAVIFVAVGFILGCLLSASWIIIKILSGLPFSDSRQLEDRLGLPVIADWSKNGKTAPGTPTPALLQTINGNRAQTIQVTAPGLNGQGASVAESLAQFAAASGRKTLLLLIEPGAQQANIQPTGVTNMHVLRIRPENVMDEKAFPDALSRFRKLYEKIIIEAGAVNDPATVNWISHFSDQDVVVVGRGLVSKNEIASRVRSLYRPNAAPVALMMVNPNSAKEKRGEQPVSSAVPPGPVRPLIHERRR